MNILHLACWSVFKFILFICPRHALLTVILAVSFIGGFFFILEWILSYMWLVLLGRSITQSRTPIADLRIHVSPTITFFFVHWSNLGSFWSQQLRSRALIVHQSFLLLSFVVSIGLEFQKYLFFIFPVFSLFIIYFFVLLFILKALRLL